MAGASVGFFGKLPSNGDFIERRIGSGFREVWDEWMQRCLVQSQQDLGAGWLDCYLTSPIWRFFLCDGVAGPASYAGVFLPSVDRVGRYFPLTVAVELPAETQAGPFARRASAWFESLERLCADAVQNPEVDLSQFDAAVASSGQQLAGLDQIPTGSAFPAGAPQWRWPCASAAQFADALSDPLAQMAQGALRPMTLWWTEGSQMVQPSVLLIRALPRPDSFAALLAGNWQDGRWEGGLASATPVVAEALVPAVEYALVSAGATDVGMVRENNQDNLLCSDANRLWAVADGMGGHRDGAVASQMVIDALNALEPTATLNACFQSVVTALGRVNADLSRSALGVRDAASSGSTVVVLAIRGSEWGAFWAGDSRLYVYRAGTLVQLTSDHAVTLEAPAQASAVPGAPLVPSAAQVEGTSAVALLLGHPAPAEPAARPVASGEITRAVGGEETLELDYVAGKVVPGDRFLLCSDGLYTSVKEPEMLACLQRTGAQEASAGLIAAARGAGARDNVTVVLVDVLANPPASNGAGG